MLEKLRASDVWPEITKPTRALSNGIAYHVVECKMVEDTAFEVTAPQWEVLAQFSKFCCLNIDTDSRFAELNESYVIRQMFELERLLEIGIPGSKTGRWLKEVARTRVATQFAQTTGEAREMPPVLVESLLELCSELDRRHASWVGSSQAEEFLDAVVSLLTAESEKRGDHIMWVGQLGAVKHEGDIAQWLFEENSTSSDAFSALAKHHATRERAQGFVLAVLDRPLTQLGLGEIISDALRYYRVSDSMFMLPADFLRLAVPGSIRGDAVRFLELKESDTRRVVETASVIFADNGGSVEAALETARALEGE